MTFSFWYLGLKQIENIGNKSFSTKTKQNKCQNSRNKAALLAPPVHLWFKMQHGALFSNKIWDKFWCYQPCFISKSTENFTRGQNNIGKKRQTTSQTHYQTTWKEDNLTIRQPERKITSQSDDLKVCQSGTELCQAQSHLVFLYCYKPSYISKTTDFQLFKSFSLTQIRPGSRW